MSTKSLREILDRLWQELQRADDLDPDARRKLEALHRGVDRIEEPEAPDQSNETGSLWDQAKELETQFAAGHPTLERIARDLADALGKMGL